MCSEQPKVPIQVWWLNHRKCSNDRHLSMPKQILGTGIDLLWQHSHLRCGCRRILVARNVGEYARGGRLFHALQIVPADSENVFFFESFNSNYEMVTTEMTYRCWWSKHYQRDSCEGKTKSYHFCFWWIRFVRTNDRKQLNTPHDFRQIYSLPIMHANPKNLFNQLICSRKHVIDHNRVYHFVLREDRLLTIQRRCSVFLIKEWLHPS